VKIWGDDRFSRLSKPQPNGQTLWLYLLTGPHTTTLPTAFVAGEAGLAEALGWSLASFRKVFMEVLAEGLVEVDMKCRLVFIPKAVRHNPPQSPNVVIAWRKAFDELPDCALKQRVFSHTLAELIFIGKGEAFQKAFGDTFIYTFVESEQNNTNTNNRTEQMGKRPRPVETATPDVLPITEEMRAWANANGFSDSEIAIETPAMLDHFRSKGETKLDWIATWRNWIRRSRKFGGRNQGTPPLGFNRPSKEEIDREAEIQFGWKNKKHV
jgi:hypothetical protein